MFHLDNNSGIDVMPVIKQTLSRLSKWFTEGDSQTPPSYPGADWFNIVQAELLNVLKEAGVEPNKSSLNQLSHSINVIIENSFKEIKDKFQYDEFESRVYSPNKLIHFVVRNDGISGIYSKKKNSFLWSFNERGELNGKIEAKNIINLSSFIPDPTTLSSSIDSESTGTAANSLAVKTVNDKIDDVRKIYQYDAAETRFYAPDRQMRFVVRNDGISGIYSSSLNNGVGGFLWSFNERGELNGKIEARNVIGLNDSVKQMFLSEFNDSGGFLKLPNGLIFQWGFVEYLSSNGARGTPQSFYTSFPSRCLSVVVSDYGDGANSISANPITPSQFVCWAKTLNNRYETSKLHYIAIGI